MDGLLTKGFVVKHCKNCTQCNSSIDCLWKLISVGSVLIVHVLFSVEENKLKQPTKYFFTEELEINGAVYVLKARIRSTHPSGQRFYSIVQMDLPSKGLYVCDEMDNHGLLI